MSSPVTWEPLALRAQRLQKSQDLPKTGVVLIMLMIWGLGGGGSVSPQMINMINIVHISRVSRFWGKGRLT